MIAKLRYPRPSVSNGTLAVLITGLNSPWISVSRKFTPRSWFLITCRCRAITLAKRANAMLRRWNRSKEFISPARVHIRGSFRIYPGYCNSAIIAHPIITIVLLSLSLPLFPPCVTTFRLFVEFAASPPAPTLLSHRLSRHNSACARCKCVEKNMVMRCHIYRWIEKFCKFFSYSRRRIHSHFLSSRTRACASFYFTTENSTRAMHYLSKCNYEMLRRVPMFSPILIRTLVPNQFVISRAFFMRTPIRCAYISRARIYFEFLRDNEKYFMTFHVLSGPTRKYRPNYFRNSFHSRIWYVREKEMPWLEACRQRSSSAFLRWHPTRVSCVFIRSVGLPRNENGVPGGVRRELVFLTHFSRRRTPENRLSPRGLAERRAQCYTFAILASHPFQSSLDVKSTLRVVVAAPSCENEGE